MITILCYVAAVAEELDHPKPPKPQVIGELNYTFN